jgi:hypothetical protein
MSVCSRTSGTEVNTRDEPCGDEQRHRVNDQSQQEEHHRTARTITPTLPSRAERVELKCLWCQHESPTQTPAHEEWVHTSLLTHTSAFAEPVVESLVGRNACDRQGEADAPGCKAREG